MAAGDAGAGGGVAVAGAEAEDVAAGAQYSLVYPIMWPLNPPPLPNAFVGVHPAFRVMMIYIIRTLSTGTQLLTQGDIVIRKQDNMQSIGLSHFFNVVCTLLFVN